MEDDNVAVLEAKNSKISEQQDQIKNLKDAVLKNLIETGFTIGADGRLIVPDDKEYYRKVNASAVEFLRNKRSKFIQKVERPIIEKYIIDGRDLDVNKIDPFLIEVTDNEKNNLFNWIKLHWSIPISSGYGRRLRYIVGDKSNGAVIGIIGLGDPVYAMHDRDTHIGWSTQTKKERLRHLMDAFVLGAVPPYSMVLGGKLVAALASSPVIRERFRQKYRGSVSRISGRAFDGRMAGITTSSALGKSSLYDRIKIPDGPQFLHVGWTRGSGEFQFLNELYNELYEIAKSEVAWKKNPSWGSGIRNRRTLIQSALKVLGLPINLGYHNIKREIFLLPLGNKSLEFLRGQYCDIKYYNLSQESIAEYMLKRWVIPRSLRDNRYEKFTKWEYSISKS
jgi:hypothetical protein